MSSNSTSGGRTAKYHSLIDKLLSLTHAKKWDKNSINAHLSDLNDLDYKLHDVPSDAVMLLAINLVRIVQPMETALIKNTCQFLIALLSAEIKSQSRTFVTCKRWALEILEFCDLLASPSILLLLQHLLLAENDIESLQLLFGEDGLLLKFLIPPFHCIDSTFHAIGCIQAAIVKKNNKSNMSLTYISNFKSITVNTLLSLPYSCKDIQNYNKIADSCLKILHIIIADKLISVTSDMIGEILGIVQAFLFYGIKGYHPIMPQCLRPAAMNLPEKVHSIPRTRISKNDKFKYKKQAKKSCEKNIVTLETSSITKCSSGSETSDTESNNSVYRDVKIREEAICLLKALIKNGSNRDIFGYWPQIVATGSRKDARVIAQSILKEPSSKVKQIVLNTLSDLLTSSTAFLMHAEDTDHVSFITFFGTVSLMIKELHFSLSLALSTEKNIAVLIHLLKCATALIQGTPYSRLKPGLATKLIRNSRLYMHHKDPTVRVTVLCLFEALASCSPSTPEIYSILEKQYQNDSKVESWNTCSCSNEPSLNFTIEEVDFEDFQESLKESSEETQMTQKSMSSLVQICLQNISNQSANIPVRLQSLKLIGNLSVNATNLILNHLEIITNTLISATQETKPQVALNACRVLEILAGLFSHRDLDDNYTMLFWELTFDILIALVQDTQIILREAACDCLGSIGANIFSQLSRQKTVLVITVLFGAARDKESTVKSAGLRALGMLVTIPCLEEDTGFLMDLANIACSAAENKNLSVRVKAIWTLANLCNCLTRRRSIVESEPIPLDVLLPELYEVGIKATKDNDNVKCNAVRVVGNVLYLCPERQMLKDTSVGLNVLINCAAMGGDMKVRWNACRAIGLILSSNPDNILPSTWRDQVFPALSTLICHSPNFKVRTNAAWALSVCDNYGKYVIPLWKSVIQALENSQHVANYTEYPHRDALAQQLCLTLAHLALCTETSQLQALWSEIEDHIADISGYIQQFQKTILPENAGNIAKAQAKFKDYSKTAISSELSDIAHTIGNLFEKTSQFEN
ncbi:HEAT repeat-containing protein 6-like [Prorops nasuta]|uniref:HEAT repeat-containing protein 6-like n=1 Tax=Prorops nasuta TaxID=863751 RepID=UPI0034CDB587